MLTNETLLEIYKLKNIIRYNNKLTITKESVAEHSFYVALISLKICDIINAPNEVQYRCIVKALLHDMPEIELNDITHDVKEKLNLRSFLEKYELEYISKNFSEHKYLFEDKEQIVDLVVDLADILSVKQYALTELSIGNKTDVFDKILKETEEREINTISKLIKSIKENGYETK